MRGLQSQMLGQRFVSNMVQPSLYYSFNKPQNYIWQNFSHYTTSLVHLLSMQSNKLASDMSLIVCSIEKNNKSIIQSVNKLQQTCRLLEKNQEELLQNLIQNQQCSQNVQNTNRYRQPNLVPFGTNKLIINNIFGRRQFTLKLKLQNKFPTIIYKDRKINIRLKLINPDGSLVCNANLINLCIGVCDRKGNWIAEEGGDFFMKGKIQVELYHGEAEFRKLHPVDISRRYSAEGINIVIYPKPSLIRFTGESLKHQKIIDCDLIEPLIIHDVTVKAKKINRE